MREKRTWLFKQMKLEAYRDEYNNWLIICYFCAVNNCPEEYCPPMPLPFPLDYIKNLNKRSEMARKGILPSPLKMILKTCYLLPVQKQPPPVSPP